MAVIDPIADMLTRIRNGLMLRKTFVLVQVPGSKRLSPRSCWTKVSSRATKSRMSALSPTSGCGSSTTKRGDPS